MSGKKPSAQFNGSRGITRKPTAGLDVAKIIEDAVENETQIQASTHRDLAISTLVACMRAPAGKTGDLAMVGLGDDAKPMACATFSQKVSAAQTILAYADGRPGPMIRDVAEQRGITINIVKMGTDGVVEKIVMPVQFDPVEVSPEVEAMQLLGVT